MDEQEQLARELHRARRIHYPTRATITEFIGDLYQADLVDLQSLQKWNKPFKYLLTVIDTFSRFAFARPLKNKTAAEVTVAFADILRASKRIPKHLQTDEGKEFFNTSFRKLMKQHGINHYHTYGDSKAAFVERFNKTLKNKMYRAFTKQNTLRWTDMLQKLISQYNNSFHRMIQRKPASVRKKHEPRILQYTLKQQKRRRRKRLPLPFKVGDLVRVSHRKKVFSRGYTPNWSEEIFRIVRVNRTYPVTYKLEDLKNEHVKGTFYHQELQKTKIPNYFRIEKVLARKTANGQKLIRVKWQGYDNRFNQWIPLSHSQKV